MESGASSTCWKVTATTTPVQNPRGNKSPPRTGNRRAAYGGSPYGDRLNCWNPLKPCVPQHRIETNPGVTAAKAEKNTWMAQGASLNAGTMGDQQRSLEQRNVQRLSLAGVGPSGPKRSAPRKAGEDIVCAHVKAWGVRLVPGGAALEQRPNVNKTDETAYGRRRRCPHRHGACTPALRSVRLSPGQNHPRTRNTHTFAPPADAGGAERR